MESFYNIVIVSLCDSLSVQISKVLSQSLGMMFCSTKDLIEYELIDKNKLQKLCSKQYIDDCEKKVIKQISSFENVVVSINFDYLIHNVNILKERSLIIFINFSQKIIKEFGSNIDNIAFPSRIKKFVIYL